MSPFEDTTTPPVPRDIFMIETPKTYANGHGSLYLLQALYYLPVCELQLYGANGLELDFGTTCFPLTLSKIYFFQM